jgi:uncharacterized repeat protein (TIGR03803 family)
MPRIKRTLTMTAGLTMFALTVLLAGTPATAQQERILHSFSNNSQGEFPVTDLIIDTAGNLYGTTSSGGGYGQGTVFELSPKAGGGWTQKILHSFGNGNDGQSPWGGRLLMDASGNLYGTTRYGGTGSCNPLNPVSCGTVFELMPNGSGGWREKVLYSFNGGKTVTGTDGYHPAGGLVMDATGNLYGTTFYGGIYETTSNGGTVFKLTPSASGAWTEEILHNFGNGGDGNFLQCTLAMDSAGKLYGTTVSGGSSGGGTVFEMSSASGTWTENIIFTFDAGDNDPASGLSPLAGVAIDASGNLYGTTGYGGSHYMGNVFELTPSAGGVWTETVIHTFGKGDGNTPQAGLILDAAGNVYGTTFMGGKFNVGVVFRLSPAAGGWTETFLHNFQPNGVDGTNPESTLVMDSHGNLYGSTLYGGAGSDGTVFQIKP